MYIVDYDNTSSKFFSPGEIAMGASITLIPSLPSLSSRSGIRLEVEKGSSDPGGEPASVGLYIHDIRVCGIAVRADDGKEEKVRRQSNAKDGLTVMLTIV